LVTGAPLPVECPLPEIDGVVVRTEHPGNDLNTRTPAPVSTVAQLSGSAPTEFENYPNRHVGVAQGYLGEQFELFESDGGHRTGTQHAAERTTPADSGQDPDASRVAAPGYWEVF